MTNTLKRFSIFLLCVAIAFVSSQITLIISKKSFLSDMSAQAEMYAEKLNSLSQQNKLLSEEIKKIHAEAIVSGSGYASVTPSSSFSAKTQLLTTNEKSSVEPINGKAFAAMREVEIAAEDSIGKIKAAGYKNFIDQVINNFSSEPIDASWAVGEESRLRELFNNKDLSGLALKNTECKSEQCKISVAAATLDESNSTTLKLTDMLSHADQHVFFASSYDPENSTVDIYISKDATNFKPE